MKKYKDFDKIEKVKWTRFVIVVPTEEDKQELMEAFEHIHYSDIDTDNITVNQLAHQYLDETVEENTYNNIIVDRQLYNPLQSRIEKKKINFKK